MGYVLKTAASIFPITLVELKEHLRLPAAYTSEDARLNFFIQAATGFAEKYTGRQMLESTWLLYLNSFPSLRNDIEMGRCPVTSISSITYKDTSNATQTFSSSNYELVNSAEPAYLRPVYGKEWPTAINSPNSVIIEFKAGYTSAQLVPVSIRQAIFMICADMWANRETIVVGRITSSIPLTAEKLLDFERIIYHG